MIGLGFFQTTIMEMGEPPTSDEAAGPPGWVQGRQYTGRVVTVTNDKIFDQPIYNYTWEFRFLMGEMRDIGVAQSKWPSRAPSSGKQAKAARG